MSDKTCADCRLFAPEPDDRSFGACLDSLEARQDIVGRSVSSYEATHSDRKACPDFEPKEAGR